MIIHVVQPGETISTIADYYNISESRLIQENGIINPDALVIGQTIVIVYANEIYTVKEGDTLAQIAAANNITLRALLRNNPFHARSIIEIMRIVPEYGFIGTNIWNIIQFFAQMWLIINTQYEIETILEIDNR